MSLSQLWTEIENEQSWRFDEIRFFQNRLAEIKSEEDREKYRKALVLILYSHFEGFCKFAFLHYIKAVNEEKVKADEVNTSLAATALADLFDALRNTNKKSDFFCRTLPDDTHLHRFSRDREFLENINEVYEKNIQISEKVVDTESNLKPVILQKILFRLGFQHNKFDNLKDKISKLLNYRNKIAHGESKAGIPGKTYEELRENVYSIMNEVKRDIMDALINKEYLRN